MAFNAATEERYKGCLLELAAGYAVGTTLEPMYSSNFTPITDMISGGPFNLDSGQWIDDTSTALYLVHSLIHNKGIRYNI